MKIRFSIQWIILAVAIMAFSSGQKAFAVLPASIGDRVWNDLNGNGQQDDGEPGLAGVTVTLWECGLDGQVGTADDINTGRSQVTPASDAYLFSGLAPGCYFVTFSTPAGYVPTRANSGNDASDSDVVGGMTGPYTLVAGVPNLTVDAGFYQPVSLGDFVWNDANANGQQDDGANSGLAGVTVTLWKCGPDGQVGGGDDINTGPSQVTPASGAYLFSGLAPGCYFVTFSTPAGYVPTTANSGNDASDSDAVGGMTGPYTLVAGVPNLTVDAGFYQPVSLGDYVWNDANANGIQDAGETGINGVTVTLTGTDGAGHPVSATTTTDGNGNYSFTEPPGTYSVAVAPPAGYTSTATGKGTTATDSNPSPSGTTPGTLASGGSDLTIDFGFYQPVTIGNFVWNDLNGNGVQDAGEPGILGVPLTLTGTGGAGNPVSAATTAAANGYYSFTEPPGTYSVAVAPPAGYSATFTGQGTLATDSNPGPSGTTPLTLAGGGSDQTIDFGFYQPVTIGNFVWNDLNGNGVQDAGEPGILGVPLTLTGTDGAGNPVSATTTTDANGYYSFTEPPGTYSVAVTTPSGYTPTATGKGTPATDSNPGPSGTTPLTLAGGGSDQTIDFGFYQPAAPCLEMTKTASKTTLAPYEPVTYTYVVHNCGNTTLINVVVTDDNGTPNTASDDFTVGIISSLAPGASATHTATVIPVVSTVGVVNGNTVPAGAIIVVTTLLNGDIKVTYLQDFGINDNTYGTGCIGWPGNSHTFGNLTGSDKLEFRFFDKNGAVVLDFYLDTISAAGSVNVPGAPVGS